MLIKHIQQLLKENDEVVVPKLGTFVAGYAGSEISGVQVAPPKKKIHFYEKLKSDKNELLRKRVTEKESISIADFQRELDQFVDGVYEKLNQNGKADIEGLGTIRKKPDGSIDFEQNQEENLLDDAFGLPSLERRPIAKRQDSITSDNTVSENTFIADSTEEEPLEDDNYHTEENFTEESNKENEDQNQSLFASFEDPVEKQKREEFLRATSSVENPPSTTEQSSPETQTDMPNDREEEEEEKKSSIVIWLIAVPLIFIAGFMVYILANKEAGASLKAMLGTNSSDDIIENVEETPENNLTDNQNTTDEEANNSFDNTVSETGTDTETTTDESNNNPNADNEQTNINSAEQPDDIINESRDRFYLVIGSFAQIDNARDLRTNLKNNGVSDAKIVMYPKRGMYRVTVGDQGTKREAYNQRLDVLDTYPDTWVLNY